ncbi:MAG: glutamine amidotransferase [Aeoliella sp.]
MNTWGVDPVGGVWFFTAVAILLTLALFIGPAGKKLSGRRRLILVALRGGTALLLLLAMLRPTLVTIETRKQPGSLVLMVDNSRSMQINDSVGNASRWNALKQSLVAASDQLSELAEAWDLKLYQFDQETDPVTISDGVAELADEADGPQSAIGSALDDILQREARQRIVAVLLLSDGAQRAFAPRDVPPQTVARRLAIDQIPLYTFTFGKPALGLQSDLRVDDILANDVVFAETPTNIQAMIGADGYANQTFKVQLLWETPEGEMEVVDTRQVLIETGKRRIPVTLSHTPYQPGEYKVSVQIESPEGELATTNNSQSTFVTVLKGGVNVLYLVGSSRVGGGPGIEPRFIRGALAPHADINVRYDLLNYRRKRINIREQLREGKYDVYLLGNVDVSALDDASWRGIAEDVDRGAGLAMLGGFHSFGPGGFRGSPLEDVLPVVMGLAERQNFGEPPRQDMHVAGPIRFSPVELGGGLHPILRLKDETQSELDWTDLPPLDGANRWQRAQLKPNAQVIAETADARRWPLMVAGAWGSGRTLALAIDSTWRWQMEGFGDVQRRFWRQLILWLARKDDAEGQAVWVRLDGRRYQRGSRVEFAFGATDDQSEPLEDATFDVQIHKPDGSEVAVRPTRRGEAMMGSFQEADQPGDYRVTIAATQDGQLLGTAEARFTVPDRDMELDQPAAEPTLMASLANLTAEAGGAGLAPEELPTLLEQLKSRTKDYEEEISRKRSLWDTWPVFLSLVALLGGEWWLRKRWGLV